MWKRYRWKMAPDLGSRWSCIQVLWRITWNHGALLRYEYGKYEKNTIWSCREMILQYQCQVFCLFDYVTQNRFYFNSTKVVLQVLTICPLVFWSVVRNHLRCQLCYYQEIFCSMVYGLGFGVSIGYFHYTRKKTKSNTSNYREESILRPESRKWLKDC